MELSKDHTILQILSHLEQRFGKDSFRTEDYWDTDLCAVGLADNPFKYLLYLNTYGKPKGTFHVELEDNVKTDSTNKSNQVFGALGIKELEDVFRQYFINMKSYWLGTTGQFCKSRDSERSLSCKLTISSNA